MTLPASPVNPRSDFAGVRMSRIWHCFGNTMHRVDLDTVLAMLAASRSNVLPVNTHLLDPTSGRKGLLIGFGGVQFDEVAPHLPMQEMVVMLNINHQTSARAAIDKTVLAHALTGERIVKLEVLNADMRTSNDTALIEAVRHLRQAMPELIIMPLLHNDAASAQTLVDLGCPLLRVMGSGIGDGKGIVDEQAFARICALPVPVVLDGGVRDARDYAHAHRLGAVGCLVNSALFDAGDTPQARLARFLADSQDFLA
jgi:thiazole synthase